MIAETIRLLQSHHWYGCSDTIEIDKGKNALPKTWKEGKEKVRRAWHFEMSVANKDVESNRIIKKITSWLFTKR